MSSETLTETSGSERVRNVLDRIERRQRIRRILSVIGVLTIVVLTGLGMTYLGFTVAEVVRQFGIWVNSVGQFATPDFERFTIYSRQNAVSGWAGLYQSFLHPGTFVDSVLRNSQVPSIVGYSVVTIVIGFTGTVLGFPLALTFGVLGSERVTPFPFNFIFRGVMSTIRAIPALVWVLIYIPLTGISPVSAMLAVGTDTIGNLGRLFTDELEEIDEGPIEAIKSTGASRSQTVSFGMLSQVSTSFIAWTLYILEINVRIAISLGVIGAGGIGQYINNKIALTEYSQAAAGIFMVIVIVLTVEMISSRLRARLRPQEHEGSGIIESIKDLGNMEKWFGTGG
ncbi:MAG: phosphonate ABC transporter, permease protein PhnE [Halobacteria archaeon]|nr:phosphonate ABC transporter, permease protein PhnE [Halobacteria archaeon]